LKPARTIARRPILQDGSDAAHRGPWKSRTPVRGQPPQYRLIVGLPNVGKSTLFNALTKTAAAQAANYPFCTIEPNTGEVAVPDPRLKIARRDRRSKEIIPTRINFVDIAGLVRGASKGEGLGNQFLANIREVDAIVHVLRCFEDDDITHVEGPHRSGGGRRHDRDRTDARRPRKPRAPRRADPQARRRQGQGIAGAAAGHGSSVVKLLNEGKPAAAAEDAGAERSRRPARASTS
jgi:hypothetical protein